MRERERERDSTETLSKKTKKEVIFKLFDSFFPGIFQLDVKTGPRALHTIERFSKYRPPMGAVVGDSESPCVGYLKNCDIVRWFSIFDEKFAHEPARSGSCPHKVVFTLQGFCSSAVKVCR